VRGGDRLELQELKIAFDPSLTAEAARAVAAKGSIRGDPERRSDRPAAVADRTGDLSGPKSGSRPDREREDGRLIEVDPKSNARNRTVAFPADIMPELADYLERFADPKPHGPSLHRPKGAGTCAGRNFRTFWYRAREAVGLPELHFHACGTPATP